MRSEITAEKVGSAESYNAIVGGEALSRMLQYRRPAGTKTERRFIARWLDPLGLDHDKFGNLSCRIGTSNVMWSCHTDTVHYEGGLQTVVMRGQNIMLAKSEGKGSRSNCLGADDTAGVWLMREMIMAKKPGLYIFHREEEVGGHGSTFIAKNQQKLLEGIDMAIALDRKGFGSVITHQFSRCCSDAFGHSLANGLGGKFDLDDSGTFTDTANYVDLIPECTNLSVGYEHAHSSDECLNAPFLFGLREQLLALDTGKLTIARDPNVPDRDDFYSRYSRYTNYSDNMPHGGSMYDLDRYAGDYNEKKEVVFDSSFGSLQNLVREYPDEVADLLESYGLNCEDVAQHIMQTLDYRGK